MTVDDIRKRFAQLKSQRCVRRTQLVLGNKAHRDKSGFTCVAAVFAAHDQSVCCLVLQNALATMRGHRETDNVGIAALCVLYLQAPL